MISNIRRHIGQKGVTLVELLVGVAMIGIFAMGMIAAYNMINRGVIVTKGKSIATNLAQEQVEKLKDYNYYRLLVTPTAALANPADPSNPFPPESITVANIAYTRSTVVRKLMEDTGTGTLSILAPTDPDDGIKRIEVTLTWSENNQTRTITLFNLYNNKDRTQQDGVIKGNVKSTTSTNLPNVNVFVSDNPNLYSYTDASGNYSFRAPGGTYTLRADKKGYTSQVTGSFTLATGTTITSNFINYALKPVGTASGYVFTRNHLLVSEVCTQYSAGSPQQYVELYNPTTSTITVNGNYTLYYYNTTANIKKSLTMVWGPNTAIKPFGFYLFGSAALVNGIPPDAYWTDGNVLDSSKGAVGIADGTGNWVDRVAWSKAGNSAPSDGTETSSPDLSFWGGLVTGYVLERRPYPGLPGPGLLGNAYDSENNSSDFHMHNSPSVQNYSSATEAPASGTIVTGAYVFSEDDVSSPTVSTGTGTYTLTNIAAGTWKLAGSGAGYYGEQSPVVISASATTTATLVLTGVATVGYITGRVSTGATPLSGIAMFAGASSSTDGNGDYILPVPAGAQYVTANYLTGNINYTTDTTATPITIVAGGAVTGIDFNLSTGGAVSGKVTTNGTDPLPYVPVIAKDFSGNERGNAITDAAGVYTIKSLDTSGNSYSIFPALDEKEVGTPSGIVATVVAGTTSPGFNFQVTNGLANISGTAKISLTNQAITTGVLVIATTASIATSTAPTINSAVRATTPIYYSDTTDSNGNYSIPVRGSATGTAYNVYAWYTNAAGITSKATGSTTVTSGKPRTVDFGF